MFRSNSVYWRSVHTNSPYRIKSKISMMAPPTITSIYIYHMKFVGEGVRWGGGSMEV